MAKKKHVTPDVVITDKIIEGMSSLELDASPADLSADETTEAPARDETTPAVNAQEEAPLAPAQDETILADEIQAEYQEAPTPDVQSENAGQDVETEQEEPIPADEQAEIEETPQAVEEKPTPPPQFERSPEQALMGEIVDQYVNGEIAVPALQRGYVTNDDSVVLLVGSLMTNIGFGDLCIAECDGVRNLVDGLQRTQTCLNLLEMENEELAVMIQKALNRITAIIRPSLPLSITPDELKERIRNYPVRLDVHKNLTIAEMKHLFRMRNNGTKLASVVKERAALGDAVEDALLRIGTTLKPYMRGKTPRSQHHHEVIASNILLASIIEYKDDDAYSGIENTEKREQAKINDRKDATINGVLENKTKQLMGRICQRQLNNVQKGRLNNVQKGKRGS